MKKILTVMFALLLVMSCVLTTFAANGSFVSSPSKNLAPVLVSAQNDSEACTATIVITSYADRATLDSNAQLKLEAAYDAIAAAEDMGAMDADIAALAEELDISSADFAVTDLFDISYTGCDAHEAHGGFTITIKPASVENFAGVLHLNGSDWELIEGEVKNGEITFEAEELSPFALMVHAGLPEQPAGNATAWIIGGGIFLLLLIILIIVLLVLSRKKKKTQAEEG